MLMPQMIISYMGFEICHLPLVVVKIALKAREYECVQLIGRAGIVSPDFTL